MPGVFLCPSNPHPKVNEYHTICCSESDITYGWEISGGRDHLIPMGRPQFEISANVKMIGIMLQLTGSL